MASAPEFEPGPHWWEASALTTAPPLLSKCKSWKMMIQELTTTSYNQFNTENVIERRSRYVTLPW